MKRRGFLFGLFAAPLVPVVVKAAPLPAATASRGHLIAPQLLPGASVPVSDGSWNRAWLDLAEKYGVPLLGKPSSGPRGGCYDPDFVEYADRDGRPILRIPQATFEAKLSDSYEADGEVEPPPGSGPPRRGRDR